LRAVRVPSLRLGIAEPKTVDAGGVDSVARQQVPDEPSCKSNRFRSSDRRAVRPHDDISPVLCVGAPINLVERVCVCIPSRGYAGVGIVTKEAVMARDFVPDGYDKPLLDLPLDGPGSDRNRHDPDGAEWVVGVKWIQDRPQSDATWEQGMFVNQNIACRMRHQFTIDRLTDRFGLSKRANGRPLPLRATDGRHVATRPGSASSPGRIWLSEPPVMAHPWHMRSDSRPFVVVRNLADLGFQFAVVRRDPFGGVPKLRTVAPALAPPPHSVQQILRSGPIQTESRALRRARQIR